ncbi:Aspartate/glutamate/uridylate kinase [Flammula alnicola]|nr:Aspartate/glutamate/uridylate kinase [Flammula alnicola]
MPVPANMNIGSGWIVQSFSGDSIRSSALRIATDIVPRYLRQHRIVIVCLACVATVPDSSSQLLLRAASKVRRYRDGTSRSPGFSWEEPDSNLTLCAELFRFEYSILARTLVHNPALVESLRVEINTECDWLRKLSAISNSSEYTPPKSQVEDVILGMSEKLSSHILNHVLLEQGFQTEIILAEDIEALIGSDREDGSVSESFMSALASRIQASHPKIPIVTGMVNHKNIPRPQEGGFSESLSILAAIGLGAIELQLWNASNDILTADLRRVSSARLVRSISRSEAAELALHGHPCTSSAILDEVTSRDISVKLCNTEDDNLKGTVIRTLFEPIKQNPFIPVRKATQPLRLLASKTQTIDRRPTAVIVRESAFMINVTAHAPNTSFGFLDNVFRVLQKHEVQLDMMSTTQAHIAVTVEDEKFQGDIGRLADELGQYGIVFVQYGLALLTVVGDQLRNNPGISGRVVSTLTQGGIRVNMVGPGTGTSLSCAISSKEVTRAVRLLHHTLCRKLDKNGSAKKSFLQ